MLADELCLDGPICAAPRARDQVDAFVSKRQIEFLTNLGRNVAQQPDVLEYRPIFRRGLQIELHCSSLPELCGTASVITRRVTLPLLELLPVIWRRSFRGRSDKEYCSNACRMRAYRKRKGSG